MNKAVVALVIAILLLGPAAGQGGGGTVNNQAINITAFSGDRATVQATTTAVERFTLTVSDGNGEADVARVQLTFFDPGGTARETVVFSAPFVHDVPQGGWESSDATPNDGILEFQYEHTWLAGAYAIGQWRIQADAEDYAGANDTQSNEFTTVEAGPNVVADPCTFDGAGTTQVPDCVWGKWDVNPGDTMVPSLNYIGATNTGGQTGPVAVDFTQSTFQRVGAGSPVTAADAIPIDGNIVFEYAVVNIGSDPDSVVTWVQGTVAAEGNQVFSLPPGKQIWVRYVIQQVPDYISSGQYSATYSWA